MTDTERAHLTEIVLMARARGLIDSEIATMLRAEADALGTTTQPNLTKDEPPKEAPNA